MLGVRIMKAWELARLILPSISSRAPHKTHLPASGACSRDLVHARPDSTRILEGDLGQRRVRLVEEDSSHIEVRPRITCNVV